MPIENKDVTWVEEPIIGFWEATFLPAIIEGLKTTVKHVTNYQPTTEFFPEEKPTLPLHYRGVHRLNRDDQGRVKCVACMMCATACPAFCIHIVAGPHPDPAIEKFPVRFDIEIDKCVFCGYCEEACPVDAIRLTTDVHLTDYKRENMIYDKEFLMSWNPTYSHEEHVYPGGMPRKD